MEGVVTIQEAKDYLRDNCKAGVKCPCCKQNVKLYRRKLHKTMALSLISLYKLGSGYQPINMIMRGISENGPGDFSKLKYWGMIEQKPNDTEYRSSGFWRITEKGKSFVYGDLQVQETALVYNGRCLGFEGEMLDIKKALGNKFSYNELMES